MKDYNRKAPRVRAMLLAALVISGAQSISPTLSRADRDPMSTTASNSGDPAIKCTSDDWTWTGMVSVKGNDFPNGCISAGGVDTSGVVVFTGTGVTLFGIHASDITVEGKSHTLGQMRVSIDGRQAGIVDLSSPTGDPHGKIFQVSGLTSGNHVLEVKVIKDWGVLAYVTVQNVTVNDGGKDYRIVPNNAPGKWLDIATSADNSLDISSEESQIWHLVMVGDGLFRIAPKEHPDEAITVSLNVLNPNTSYASNTCCISKYVGGTAQQWQIIATKPGFYKIASPIDKRCLNVYNANSSDGAQVIAYQWDGGGGAIDQWAFVPVQQ